MKRLARLTTVHALTGLAAFAAAFVVPLGHRW